MLEHVPVWKTCLYEGQPINIGMIVVKSAAFYTKSLIENSTQDIAFDWLF